MTRLLMAGAVALGLVLTGAPAANACAWEYCPGTSIVCQEFGCPIVCYRVPVAGEWVCVL